MKPALEVVKPEEPPLIEIGTWAEEFLALGRCIQGMPMLMSREKMRVDQLMRRVHMARMKEEDGHMAQVDAVADYISHITSQRNLFVLLFGSCIGFAVTAAVLMEIAR